MKWVTRDYVHLDRVACPWLIKRFIDPDAIFVFVPWGEEHRRPDDAIPFAIPGTELGPHDENGTTFQKILTKYRLDEPALHIIATIVAAGVDYVLHGYRPGSDEEYGQMAVGLLAVSEGMMLINPRDESIIAASLVVYDALYANFTAHNLAARSGTAMPDSAGKGPTLQIRVLRDLLAANEATRPARAL